MTDSIPWGLFLILAARWMINPMLEKKRAPQIKPPMQPPPSPARIEYWSNGFQLKRPHHIFYLQFLGFQHPRNISLESIEIAAQLRVKSLEESDPYFAAKQHYILSARNFLQEQLNYLSSLN